MPREIVDITFSTSAGYLKSVDYLLDHIQDEDSSRNPNKYAFVLVAASALESILNNAVIYWAHHRFGRGDYKRMASAFLSMSLRGKLDSFVFLASDSEFISNNESATYQQLSELIRVRNEVAHAKDFPRECELEIEETEETEETPPNSVCHSCGQILRDLEKCDCGDTTPSLCPGCSLPLDARFTVRGHCPSCAAKQTTKGWH